MCALIESEISTRPWRDSDVGRERDVPPGKDAIKPGVRLTGDFLTDPGVRSVQWDGSNAIGIGFFDLTT